jgi:hypothetical protein
MVIPQGVKLGQEPPPRRWRSIRATFAKKSNTANKIFIAVIIVIILLGLVVGLVVMFLFKK